MKAHKRPKLTILCGFGDLSEIAKRISEGRDWRFIEADGIWALPHSEMFKIISEEYQSTQDCIWITNNEILVSYIRYEATKANEIDDVLILHNTESGVLQEIMFNNFYYYVESGLPCNVFNSYRGLLLDMMKIKKSEI